METRKRTTTTKAGAGFEETATLALLEQRRLEFSKKTDAAKKSEWGQFLTPARMAAFMVSLFPDSEGACRLLDAGAGIGSLSAAFLERSRRGGFRFRRVEVDAFEFDPTLIGDLRQTLSNDRFQGDLRCEIYEEDFVEAATRALSGDLFARTLEGYTHAILNPPYKKIGSHSEHRLALRRVGIEAVNLYSAFVALAVRLTAPGGQIVALLPRSFCNGPYYRPFRDFLFEQTAIHQIHLFGSRSLAFKDDEVLQENLVIRLERGGRQGEVAVSTSTDEICADLESYKIPFERLVLAGDPERMLHIPTSPEKGALESLPTFDHTLAELGLFVSTGPIVDFRLKEHLRETPSAGTVPLLYPGHFSPDGLVWPKGGTKKPNAIERNADTEKWLYPKGFYCVVRRFSSKEEKRRIVASVVDPNVLGSAPMLGFENHLNVFHEGKRGLPELLAYGLAVFLKTTAVDVFFRQFSGHTQVNATDLKQMRFPSRDTLTGLGRWARQQGTLTQEQIDARLGSFVG